MNMRISTEAFDLADQPQWGTANSLARQGRFRVRHLVIHQNQQLGLESHLHRNEHWVVVTGSGFVVMGDKQFEIYENQSVDIPVGCPHQITNHGKVDLHLIEVQTGAYLGEDDTVIDRNFLQSNPSSPPQAKHFQDRPIHRLHQNDAALVPRQSAHSASPAQAIAIAQ